MEKAAGSSEIERTSRGAAARSGLPATVAADITSMTGMRRVRLADFEEPHRLTDEDRTAYRRRFMTLFVDDSTARRGGLGTVVRAVNALGEVYALKVMADPERAELEDGDAYAARCEAACAAFRAEYESQRAISGFKGFPRLYGYARVGDSPVIVMEWIEGMTLAQARAQLAVDDVGRLAPLAAARLGRDVFNLLTRLDLVGSGFVHRDISPANILVRTAHLSLAEQAAEGAFDLALVDFGSSVNLEPVLDASYTKRFQMLRCATAAYAPPEMLSNDISGLLALRKSNKIDVYAAASVLFELVDGRVPFDVSDAGEVSPFRVKTDESPRDIVTAHDACPDLSDVLVLEPEVALAAGQASLDLSIGPDSDELREALCAVDSQLVDLVRGCLAPDQDRRPTAVAMRDALATFCSRYAENVGHALRGERLVPCTGEPSWFDTASPYAVNRLVSAIGGAVSLAVLFGTVVMTSVLLDGVPAVWRAGLIVARMELSGIAVAFALLAPAACAFVARGRLGGTREGFLRGTAALAAVATALVLAVGPLRVAGLAASGSSPIVASVFAAAAAGWCPLVLEYAMTVVPAMIAEARRALPGGRRVPRASSMGAGCNGGHCLLTEERDGSLDSGRAEAEGGPGNEVTQELRSLPAEGASRFTMKEVSGDGGESK